MDCPSTRSVRAASLMLRRARMSARCSLLFGALVGLTACARPPNGPLVPPPSWSYEVDAPPIGSRIIVVEATFRGAKTERLVLGSQSSAFSRDVVVKNARGEFRTIDQRGGQWVEPSCVEHCTIRYQIDLGAVADGCGDDIGCAMRVGDATLSPALAWLMHPIPRADVPVRVDVRTPHATQFASGMHAIDDSSTSFSFRSFDLDEGSFSAFGPMRKVSVDMTPERDVAPAHMQVVIVGTNQYAMSDAEIFEWVDDAGDVVSSVFGRFPVARSTLFVLPAHGEREVVFGKVLSLAGASIVIVVGDQMPADRRHRDSVLVHELFHLGFPTFRGEGRWLGEGLATYYETVLRARAGWITEAQAFRALARNLPRALAKHEPGVGLAAREDGDSIYWGGALFALTSDIRVRQATNGKKSLDDVVRAVLARGGNATRVWTVREVMRVADEVTGTNVVSQLFDRHVLHGEPFDLDGVMMALGITHSPNGALDVDVQHRALRHAIVEGAPR
jgi:hypothetical protein